ncbi:hypothetical protein [Paenibacillus xylaniclasticus]|uniref:hypothetical protein n=1 Tax=Paenibacillus xylaniclasticus TaxID=588083 RepID=UPI000FDB449F|nr:MULTISPECIES: hypothetical protein [Paenibacillus]GFN31251.1 hypothetical protein PCURB6_15110 [Paenibacillus curdlanolyticus]
MSLCAVCNGIRMLDAVCPSCSGTAGDRGPVSDWMGPYAPYEPIEVDYAANQMEGKGTCRHAAYCPHCSYTFEVDVMKDID